MAMGQCSARRHLRGADFAIYDAARQLTAKAREEGKEPICSASVATLMGMTSYCEDTVTVARKRLVQSGWLKPIAGTEWVQDQRRSRAKRGQFQAPRFTVIGHEDWAVEHPSECDGGNSTVAEFPVHGKTEDGSDRDGKIRNLRGGKPRDTVHGKPRHKALDFKPEKSKPKEQAFVLPAFVSSEVWDGFVEMRGKMGKPMTELAQRLVVEKLNRLSGGDSLLAKRILEQSIERGWKSVFPLEQQVEDEEDSLSPEEFNRRQHERLFGAKESAS